MNNKYQQIFEDAIESRIIVDIKSLKILDLNKSAKKFFGTKKIISNKSVLQNILQMNTSIRQLLRYQHLQ